jgi:hypothetical protein
MSHWSGKFINYLRSIKFNNEAMNRAYELLLTNYERIRKERLEILKQMRKIAKESKIIKYLPNNTLNRDNRIFYIICRNYGYVKIQQCG